MNDCSQGRRTTKKNNKKQSSDKREHRQAFGQGGIVQTGQSCGFPRVACVEVPSNLIVRPGFQIVQDAILDLPVERGADLTSVSQIHLVAVVFFGVVTSGDHYSHHGALQGFGGEGYEGGGDGGPE